MIPFCAAPHSPAPAGYERWPVAVRSAEALHGSLLRCGPGHRAVGRPEGPGTRAAALLEFLASLGVGEPLVVLGPTAAWVWGACRSTPLTLRLATIARSRARSPAFPECLEVRQLSLAPHDVVRFGRLGVTSPRRTAADLLRAPANFPREARVACRVLTASLPGGVRELTDEVRHGPRHYRALALARIEEAA